MIHNNTAVLSGIALYHPMIEIWSGTVRVKRAEDLKEATDHLPPSELVSDGRKRIVRRDPLRPMLAIRKRVDRLLRVHGFPFMGGIAVPEAACTEIEARLPELEIEFQDAVNGLCANLVNEYDVLEQEFPSWSEMLRGSRLGEADVRARCRFDVVSHRVAAPDASQSPSAAKRFHKIADAALPTLLEDIGDSAASIYSESVRGKGRASSKTAAVVRRLVDKLGAFSFLDPRVDPMATALSKQLQSLPFTGWLSPVETATLASVLNTLADPQSLIQQGAAAFNLPDAPMQDEPDVMANPTTDDLFVEVEVKPDLEPVSAAAPQAQPVAASVPVYAAGF